MPWTAVYFLKRSTLAALSCSSPVSTASGPSSSVIAPAIDRRFSGDRGGAMISPAPSLGKRRTGSAGGGTPGGHPDGGADGGRGPAGPGERGPPPGGGTPPRGPGGGPA